MEGSKQEWDFICKVKIRIWIAWAITRMFKHHNSYIWTKNKIKIPTQSLFTFSCIQWPPCGLFNFKIGNHASIVIPIFLRFASSILLYSLSTTTHTHGSSTIEARTQNLKKTPYKGQWMCGICMMPNTHINRICSWKELYTLKSISAVFFICQRMES